MAKMFAVKLEDKEIERLVNVLTTSRGVQESCLNDNLAWMDEHDSDCLYKMAIKYLQNMMAIDKLLKVLSQKDEAVEGEAEGE